MHRSKVFRHDLRSSTEFVPESADGALPFFKATHADLIHRRYGNGDSITWNARDHRKQRHKTSSPRTGHSRAVDSTWSRVARLTHLEFWNVSWWVSVLFTFGSVVWVINGFIVFLPFVTSTPEDPIGGGWSAWVGATTFEAGSLLLILEAWNRDDTAGFGHAVKRALKGNRDDPGNEATHVKGGDDTPETSDQGHTKPKPHWKWWSNDREYWHELGFVAGISQLFGATIFWISGFTGISQIQDVLQEHPAALDGIFWTPQVVGGTGFIVSSILYMLETQKNWYVPAWRSLGWHIGFWNLIGALGFTLCGAFGYSTKSGLMYQSSLSTFWGSWAFLIGSLIQWYEAVNPVRILAAS